LPKVLYSPFYGVGLTLKLQSLFFNAKFPVSPQILAVDANVKLHSHNYFLDLTLQAGFIGLILMLNFLYQISRHSYKLNNTYGLSTAFMILAIFMKYMVDDQMEGSRGLIFWFFIVLTYVKVLNLGKHKLE
jgi:O-antigen ligase